MVLSSSCYFFLLTSNPVLFLNSDCPQFPQLCSTISPASVKMQNRKRPATIMGSSIESSTAPASDGGDRPSREALQPRPNPLAKHLRMLPSGQLDRGELAGEPCRAQRGSQSQTISVSKGQQQHLLYHPRFGG